MEWNTLDYNMEDNVIVRVPPPSWTAWMPGGADVESLERWNAGLYLSVEIHIRKHLCKLPGSCIATLKQKSAVTLAARSQATQGCL